MGKEAALKELALRQSRQLAKTLRKLADLNDRKTFSQLDIHPFDGNAPVIIQATACPPGVRIITEGK